MKLRQEKHTVGSIAMTAIDFRVNTAQITHIWTFDKHAVEEMLPEIVNLVGEDPSCYSYGIIAFFPDDSVEHFSEPPDT